MKIKKLILLSSLIFSSGAFAQMNFPLDQQLSNSVEKHLYSTSSNLHTSIRPYRFDEVNRLAKYDSIVKTSLDSNRLYLVPTSWWAKALMWSEKKLLDDHLIKIDSGGFSFRANLLLNLRVGEDYENDFSTWQNTRGYWLEGNINEEFYFNSVLYENQARLLPHVRAYANNSFVIPGQGRFKLFKENAVDWGFTMGAVGYRPNEYFNFEFGHGKHFLGDGYRSLLLSDHAASSPYFKTEANFWRMKYVVLIQRNNHIGFRNNSDRLFDTKYNAIHYLSYNANKRLNFSFFENITWKVSETRGFDWNYLNPVVIMRSIEFQNGSPDRAMLGLNSSYKILDKLTVYGQFILDDLNIAELQKSDNYWGNKFGYQLGVKAFDVFKVEGLNAQVEYNVVRPYVYTHFDSINAHTQMNEPLAHPLGANFQELVGFLRYNYKRHFIQLRYSWAKFGLDTNNINHGGNIFIGYNTNRADPNNDGGLNGHEIGQGLSTTLTILDARYSYMINPRANLAFEIGLNNRNFVNSRTEQKNIYFYVGLRTMLHNFYDDFL